jgi:hypothetical protein
MNILNVLTENELNDRLSKLRNDNWKIDNIAKTLNGSTAKEIIDNWQLPTRKEFLKLMKIKENKEFKNIYHEH